MTSDSFNDPDSHLEECFNDAFSVTSRPINSMDCTLEPTLSYLYTIVPDLRLLRTLLIALLRLVFDTCNDYFAYSTPLHASNVYEMLVNSHMLQLR